MDIEIDLQIHKDKLNITQKEGVNYFFDIIRKKYIQVLPEEMVRQLFILHLIHECKYPLSRIQVEKSLLINQMSRRFDIVVFDWQIKPFLIVECKSFKVDLNQNAADQVARYNTIVEAPFMALTNGLKTFSFEKTENEFMYTNKLPIYPEK